MTTETTVPTVDDLYTSLQTALIDITPPCSNDPRYLAGREELTSPTRMQMIARCRSCPVRDLCDQYATAARPEAGMWAGRYYERRTRHLKEGPIT